MDLANMYEVVRQHVGRTYRVEVGELRLIDFQRFAVAVGDELATTMDADAAVAAGFGGVIAPPLFLSSVSGWGWGPSTCQLRADGTSSEQLAHLPTDGLRLMGAGQSLEFLRPVVAGAKLVIETRVQDATLKDGKSGPLMIVEVERDFICNGEVAVRCAEKFIGR